MVSYSLTQKPGIPLPNYRLKFSEARKPSDLLDVAFKYTIDLGEQNHMKSNWIASIEYNPFSADTFLNLGTKVIFNVGYC